MRKNMLWSLMADPTNKMNLYSEMSFSHNDC
ncbi:hypothetical protein LSH36_1056g00000 [Paralvinella palmiformis]|uniref:Uncharacterized protein n=1 Tax=Paralvinella palmiformis TaxID=53620 RepID=A0AAD9IWQ3_9ANNE|nr:hypothetical protein LSH36_1056g00000 [Paralvinella palmiformis]